MKRLSAKGSVQFSYAFLSGKQAGRKQNQLDAFGHFRHFIKTTLLKMEGISVAEVITETRQTSFRSRGVRDFRSSHEVNVQDCIVCVRHSIFFIVPIIPSIFNDASLLLSANQQVHSLAPLCF